jgi:hypothetical protein
MRSQLKEKMAKDSFHRREDGITEIVLSECILCCFRAALLLISSLSLADCFESCYDRTATRAIFVFLGGLEFRFNKLDTNYLILILNRKS